MLGLMQHHPLLISSLLEHAASAHHSAQIVSLMPGSEAHRCSNVDIAPPCQPAASPAASLVRSQAACKLVLPDVAIAQCPGVALP
jgi:fatty-acyl-CoA synthase